jgi:hypothetical protein
MSVQTREPTTTEQDATEALLHERRQTHGSFRQNAAAAQALRAAFREAPGWPLLDDRQREALDCIALKIGRILSGQSNYVEHWDDICGYCRLAVHPDPER